MKKLCKQKWWDDQFHTDEAKWNKKTIHQGRKHL